jgi:hypothetical protein
MDDGEKSLSRSSRVLADQRIGRRLTARLAAVRRVEVFLDQS